MHDNELIKKIKEQDCEESLKILTLRHENLYYKICHKYTPALQASGVSSEDLFEDKLLVVYKAIKTFDPSRKAKFSTWLGNYTRYHCLNYIQNNTKYVILENPDDIYNLVNKNSSTNWEENRETHEKEFCFSILARLKDKRILRIFELRYSDETEFKPTWANIARHIKTSTQTVINLHSKGRNILQNKIKSKQINDTV